MNIGQPEGGQFDIERKKGGTLSSYRFGLCTIIQIFDMVYECHKNIRYCIYIYMESCNLDDFTLYLFISSFNNSAKICKPSFKS